MRQCFIDMSPAHMRRYLDRVVISSSCFPRKYWDKFIRKKASHKWEDSVDPKTLFKLLGLDKMLGEGGDWR